MLIIIAYHFYLHGGFSFPVSSITLNRLAYQFFLTGGNLGNDIFVLISGYFLIKSQGIKFSRILNLWQKLCVYALIILCIFTFSGLESITKLGVIRVIMPVSHVNWWFASTYFVMYLIHPYLNMFLTRINQDEYKNFLKTVFLYWCIIPMITKSGFQGSRLIDFMCLYSLAGYIRIYKQDSEFGSRKYILYAFMFVAINFMSAVILDLLGFIYAYFAERSTYLYDMMRPFTILAAVCFLIGFKHLNISYNKLINILASATFGVYLIHDHAMVRRFLWQNLFHNASFQDSPYLIIYSLGVVLVVYISCTIVELARSKIFKTISGGRLS
ncbi:MAG: acyltransferase family protein [Synergistaceae bacterium]|nr:acyltransferase family protein [Synergistaceae bacterium]